MNSTVKSIVITTAAVLLPLYSAFSAQAGQGAQQDVSLEARIAQLQQSIEQDPRNPDLHFELSKLYEEDVGRYYDEALSEFGLAIDNGLKGQPYNLLNESVIKANNVGTGLWKAKRYDAAIESFKLAIGLDPSNPQSYCNTAIAYSSKKEHEEALIYMKKAIDIDPINFPFYRTLGAIYLKKEDFKLVLLSCNKIKYIDSKYNEHYYGIAKAYHGLGQYENAIEALDQLPRDLRKNDTVKAFRKECVGLLKQSR